MSRPGSSGDARDRRRTSKLYKKRWCATSSLPDPPPVPPLLLSLPLLLPLRWCPGSSALSLSPVLLW
jgi:hypothetical protein